MEAKPLRSVSLPDSGKWCGPQKTHEKAGTVTIEANQSIKRETSSINLGLRIGGNTAQKPVTNEHGKPVFTPAQRQEVQLQALIFKYLSAQLPVPLHLVLPIWKSVVNALGSANIYKEYPSFIRFSPQGFDYRNMMDPEPGRCRRTDGKKWRCRKQVVSDQKYCERHLHRGLGRPPSRKPVEASEIASPPAIKPNNDSENSNANLSVSTPVIPMMIPSSSSNTSTSNNTTTPAATTSTSSYTTYTESNKNLSGNKDTTTNTSKPSTTNPAIGMISNDNSSINNHNVDRQDDGDNHGGNIKVINSSINNFRNNVSPVMGFSPKSVLQVLGCSSPCFDHSSSTDPEPGRCRRTDGKKWRCSKDVIPDQKYCVQHMHRGAKKRAVASQPVPIHATSTVTNHISTMTIPKKADCAILNMSLSLSTPAGRQLTTNDEKITTSSDSDTTITDTTDTTSTAYETSNISS